MQLEMVVFACAAAATVTKVDYWPAATPLLGDEV
jgi:hypothetical protein